MTKILERGEARELRKNGLSIGDISKRLGVSKSTASYWCRDIKLSNKQIQEIAKQQKSSAVAALLKSSEAKREMRLERTALMQKEGRQDVGNLSKRDLFILGLGLYWGEGYKKGNEELGFTNSDPEMILVFIEWLEKIYKVSREDLVLRVSINQSHNHRAKEVLKYWSEITRVPESQFTKTSFIKSIVLKKYINPTDHYGTLRVKVRRGRDLRRRILGSIEALK